MKLRAIYILAALMWASSFPGRAQAPRVSASLSADSVLIGDQFTLRVDVEKDMMQVVEFPSFENRQLANSIFIVEEKPVDTLETSGRQLKIRKEYLLTSFDAGLYDLNSYPVLYIDKNITDTLYTSDTLYLKVATFEIDTLANTIYDIKRPEGAPMMITEIGGYIITGIVSACVIASAAYFIWRARKRRKGKVPGEPVLRDPPHVEAIRQLEKLHSRKLWQSGKHKLYYSEMTDILRVYLERRYGVNAMEMTSDEILRDIANHPVPQKNVADLKVILQTADLVKFAKFIPDGETNEKIYRDSYYFVEDTKDSESEEGVTAGPGNTDQVDAGKNEAQKAGGGSNDE